VPDTVVYVDTSALVKLIVDEPETDAVRTELQQRDQRHHRDRAGPRRIARPRPKRHRPRD
jgi:predicted nucleic acid-binding protein